MARRRLAGDQKKALIDGSTIVFVDESGFYLLAGLVRTYAPRGETPILRYFQTRDHLSVMGAVTMAGQLYTRVRPHSLNSLDSVAFLKHLLVFFAKVLVVWDGSSIHRGEVRDYLSKGGAAKIHLERMPGYAPDLNPVEWAWQHVKHVELRNLCCSDLNHLRLELHYAIMRLRSKPHLVRAFFAGAGLPSDC